MKFFFSMEKKIILVKILYLKNCVICFGIFIRLINIFGNKFCKDFFVEKLENILSINYFDFENSGEVYICEKCYRIVLNYFMFREIVLLNYEKFCESI